MTRVFTPAELAALTPQAALDMHRTVLESAVYWARIATGDPDAVRDTFGRDVFADPRVGDRFLDLNEEPEVLFVAEVTDSDVVFYPKGGGRMTIPRESLGSYWRDGGGLFAVGVAPAMVAGVGTP